MSDQTMDVTVVVPTIGRPQLARMLDHLAAAEGPLPQAVLLVDDRPDARRPLLDRVPERLQDRVSVIPGAAEGPAGARNRGWRAARTAWVAFLDDDVEVTSTWFADLAADLDVGPEIAGVQGQIRVPRPASRPPTDWERDVAGLEVALWATADCAYRRVALASVGGFDERFRRAYREDADLGLRISERVGRITRGRRVTVHPVAPADPWVSVRRQAGNADDAVMRKLYGSRWRQRSGAHPGRRPRHVATALAACTAILALPSRRARRVGAGAVAAWLAGTAEFALARIRPGPRTPREVGIMAATSLVIPLAATGHWITGWWRARRIGPRPVDRPDPPQAVLLDRDGTLVVDRPYNGDPDKVELMPGAREAVARLRDAGVPTAVVSNQSGVGRGLLSLADVDRVNSQVEELLGPLGPWMICPHEPRDGCGCRKPAPGLLVEAAARLGVDPADCVVVGDVGADVDAARRAGARSVMVPTPETRPDEPARADAVARDLAEAVDIVLRWRS